MADSALHIFGIRHHGPGSARSLRAALEELKPDCVLVEGPPDAEAVIPLLRHKEMKPPVAILVYRPDSPSHAVYYPFAVFSPEWQAIDYALAKKLPVRFMDLPQFFRMAQAEPDEDEQQKHQEQRPPTPIKEVPAEAAELSPEQDEAAQLRRDPLLALASAAGYEDSERWWEHMIEQRTNSIDLFAAILEAMSALRRHVPQATGPEDLKREAHMRQTIRAAQKEDYNRIAVICGAWHAPVLHVNGTRPTDGHPWAFTEKDDAALLKHLKKTRTTATWIPWTYGRLTFTSGYGAGVRSPGWYHHLWTSKDHVATRWMTRVAHLLREEDLDCSSAHVIESVRLAETLAALRGRAIPDLHELNDAARSVFCFDTEAPMRLIAQKLIVGERLGEVPDDTPAVPLQQDVQREQKRLRLPPSALEEAKELDLRNATDLDRSRLLHRLRLLNVPWGQAERATGKGTFKEIWTLRWLPEFSVSIIEAGIWGNTVADAASAFARSAADNAPDLPTLTRLLDQVLLADLPDAIDHLMHRIENESAIAADIAHLMDALPPLASVLRYGSVRQTDTTAVSHVIDGLVARITIGVPPAVSSMNDDAAEEMFNRLLAVHSAISLLQNDPHTASWLDMLANLADSPNLHGLIAGRATRILLDAHRFTPEEAATHTSLALSKSVDPARSAAWIDGFLRGSGTLLLHDETLFNVLDQWLSALVDDTFIQLLPLLRRTFSTFPKPERRAMGQRVKRGLIRRALAKTAPDRDELFDAARAASVLPVVRQLLGIS